MLHLVTEIPILNYQKMAPSDFDRYTPQLKRNKKPNIDELTKYLNECQEKLKQAIDNKFQPHDQSRLKAIMIDQIIKYIFKVSVLQKNPKLKEQICLSAVGGYGREEMSPFSDIDLLILYKPEIKNSVEKIIKPFLYLLWDLQLEVGYSTRTLSDCKKQMQCDQTIFTSLLDHRFILGDEDLDKELSIAIQKLLLQDNFRKKFIQEKINEKNERIKKYGGSVYLLEPNVKEGDGGLRDLHLIHWLAKAIGMNLGLAGLFRSNFISKSELEALVLARNFFLNIRQRLHIMRNKKSDQLNFSFQEKIAKDFGFVDDENGTLAVEEFMKNYYTMASQVSLICQRVIKKVLKDQASKIKKIKESITTKPIGEHFKIVDHAIQVVDPFIFKEYPITILEIFQQVQETGLEIHFETKDHIQNHLNLVDESYRNNPETAALFKSIMRNYKNLGKTLFAMHEVHFFDTYIPEFRKIRNRVQHDIYHVYTIDTHSIFAIEELSKLYENHYQGEFDSLYEAMSAVKQKDLLSLGILFHDIGKGEGGNHSVVGAQIANKITKRLGYSVAEQNIIEFLVLAHLIMPHLSQRRDLEDIQLIKEFAKSVDTFDKLNMLYVLTWADIRAVSAEAWTEWKGTLLKKLYDKTSVFLKSDDYTRNQAEKKIADLRQSIFNRMKNKTDSSEFEDFIQNISARYILAHSDEEILKHFKLVQKHKKDGFFFQERTLKDADVSEVLIYTYNNPRVLPLVTGVMLAMDLNILAMEIFTLSDGTILIKLRLQTEFDSNVRDHGHFEKLKKNLHNVFLGKEKVTTLIEKNRKPDFMLKEPVQKAESRVVIDNDVSAYYTVIDIITHDRLGLLYEIVTCLADQGCYVEVSKISTKVDQVVDSFYIKDIFGHKITSKEKLNELKSALLKIIKMEEKSKSKSKLKLNLNLS